jgi:hypothetical protein
LRDLNGFHVPKINTDYSDDCRCFQW